jgi:hypothetical protein
MTEEGTMTSACPRCRFAFAEHVLASHCASSPSCTASRARTSLQPARLQLPAAWTCQSSRSSAASTPSQGATDPRGVMEGGQMRQSTMWQVREEGAGCGVTI